MIVCNGNAFMSPQCMEPGEIQIPGELIEEGFGEFVKIALSELEHQQAASRAPQITKAPESTEPAQKPQSSTEDEQILMSCLLNMAALVVTDEQPKLIELETEFAVQPEPQAPQEPQAPKTSEAPQLTQADIPETPQAPETVQQPQTSEVSETPQAVQPQVTQATQTAEATETAQPTATSETPQAVQPQAVQTTEVAEVTETAQPTATQEAPQPIPQQQFIQNHIETVKAEMNTQIPVAELPQATDNGQLTVDNGQLTVDNVQLTVDNGQLTVDNVQVIVDNVQAAIPSVQVTTDNRQPTAQQVIIPEAVKLPPEVPANVPAKAAATQLTPEAKEFLQKFGEVKFAIESGKSAEFTAEPVTRDSPESTGKPEEPMQTLKEWVNLHKAHVAIKEVPEELKELLGQPTADKEQPTADKKHEVPKAAEAPKAPDAPQVQTAAFTEQNPVIAKETELPQLPQKTIAQVSEQIFARLESAQAGTTTFEVILNPVELGKIAVKIIIQASGTAVEIIAEKASTAQLLQNSAERINYALERSDARLDSFIVNTAESPQSDNQNKPDYSEQRENQNSNKGEQQQDDSTGEQSEEETGISFAELLQAG